MIEVPTSLFIFLTIIMFLCIAFALTHLKYINIICALVGGMLAFMLSRISVNGLLVQQFGGVASNDTIITDTVAFTSQPMSYLFLFFFIISVILIVKNILQEIHYNLSPDLDIEL